MFMWFGESWGAPVNETNPHTKTPVDTSCDHCSKPIEASDQGFIFPMLDPDDAAGARWFVLHHACFLDMVGLTQLIRSKSEDR